MTPPFSGQYRNFKFYAPIKHLLYHRGPAAFISDNCANLSLTASNADLWLSLVQKALSEALKKPRIKIPGGKTVKN
jgi:hypothetical protein